MSKRTWTVLVAVGITAAVAVAVAAQVMGGCEECLHTDTGMCVPMKCHWTFRAVTLLEVVAAYSYAGLLTTGAKVARRWTSASMIVAQAATLYAIHTPYMGICANLDMHCHLTARVCTVFALVAVVAAAVTYAKADPDAASLPKRGL